mgnify:CR=1 FL=1
MGIFKNIGKIEELIEANVPGSWVIYHNALTVKDLPETDEDDTTIIDHFHQLIKLCEIISAILCQLYTVKGRKQLSVLSSPDQNHLFHHEK